MRTGVQSHGVPFSSFFMSFSLCSGNLIKGMSSSLSHLLRNHLCALLSVFLLQSLPFLSMQWIFKTQETRHFPSPPDSPFPLSTCLFVLECVSCLSYPWLPVPKGGISSLHLFEGFLIWGLGQPRSGVPSSIIPVEEQREGEEGVQKRGKSKGDGVISYLSSHSSAHPISSKHLSSSFSPSLFLSFLPSYLSIPSRLTCIQNASL